MTTKEKQGTSIAGEKREITFERMFAAPLEDVWDHWTTREGIESWWGPDGFATKVHKLDLRPGGELEYSFTTTGLEQVDFLRHMGMPITQVVRGRYLEVSPRRRLAYTNLADWIEGVEPYEVTNVVELTVVPFGVRMVLTQDAMHDEQWTKLATMGWESELGKLAKLLEQRYPARSTKRKGARK